MTVHDCERLRNCEDHPHWRVFRSAYGGGDWWSIPPGPETFPTPDENNHDTYADAHARVRDAQLAAIQNQPDEVCS